MSPSPAADVLVVGGGHNGLVAALSLARRGRRVLVLEGRDRLGGLAAAEEFHPGYTVPGLLHSTESVRPWIVKSLGLEEHALAFCRHPAPVFAPQAEGPGLLLHRDPGAATEELSRISPALAAAYRDWRSFLDEVKGAMVGARGDSGLLNRPPPPLTPGSLADFFELGRRGVALRLLGKKRLTELLRVAPMCVADWLRESFDCELLCELLAAPGVVGTHLGPYSAGSALNLLLAECASYLPVDGGPAALVEALTSACREHRVELRTGARVKRIRVALGRVTGITLQDGEELDAPQVAASCDPRQTLLDLVQPGALPTRLEDELKAYRCRGTTAKLHLALSGPLEFSGRPGQRFEAVRVGGGGLDALERAFDAVKYRRFSKPPHLDIRVPTVARPQLAPEGHHVVSVVVSFAPYDLAGGWTEERRHALAEAAVDALALCAPAVRRQIVARQVLTPKDLEERYGLTGGHLHHGEHALDQLFTLRPASSVGRYRTPIRGLFLAGSGSHPGGGLTGAPGALAARAMIAESGGP